RRRHRLHEHGAIIRRPLHNEKRRSGTGSVDLPQNHSGPWRTSMGGGKRPSWRDVHFHSPAYPIDHGVGEQLKVSVVSFVHIVDDDEAVRESLGDLLRAVDYQVMLHGSASEFLNAELPDASACLVLDVRMPGTGGLELQEYLTRINVPMPVILM